MGRVVLGTCVNTLALSPMSVNAHIYKGDPDLKLKRTAQAVHLACLLYSNSSLTNRAAFSKGFESLYIQSFLIRE